MNASSTSAAVPSFPSCTWERFLFPAKLCFALIIFFNSGMAYANSPDPFANAWENCADGISIAIILTKPAQDGSSTIQVAVKNNSSADKSVLDGGGLHLQDCIRLMYVDSNGAEKPVPFLLPKDNLNVIEKMQSLHIVSFHQGETISKSVELDSGGVKIASMRPVFCVVQLLEPDQGHFYQIRSSPKQLVPGP